MTWQFICDNVRSVRFCRILQAGMFDDDLVLIQLQCCGHPLSSELAINRYIFDKRIHFILITT